MDTLRLQDMNIYPGRYTPNREIDPLLKYIEEIVEDIGDHPSIRLEEFPDHFVIEVSVPGIPRENIFIYVHDEIITLLIKDASIHLPNLHHMVLTEKGSACHNIRLKGHIETGF